MIRQLKQLLKYSPAILGVGFSLWAAYLVKSDSENLKNLFTDTYMTIPIIGGIVGLILSKRWGGHNSFMGKSLIFFSITLFTEGLGLLIYSLNYRLNGTELSYPSIGDFIFLIGILSSSAGSWWLLRAIAPVKNQVRKPIWHFGFVLLAMSLLFYFAWQSFLYEGVVDDRGNLTVFFNILYPTAQLLYLSLCLLALLKVKNTSGGRLFLPVLVLLMSMLVLYTADTLFLKQSFEETWEAAGISDLMYIYAYSLIASSLVYIDRVRGSLVGAKESDGSR